MNMSNSKSTLLLHCPVDKRGVCSVTFGKNESLNVMVWRFPTKCCKMRLIALFWLFTGNNVRNAARIFRNFILWGFTAVPIPNLA